MTTRMMSGKGVVILGATSSIARATAAEFARNGYNMVLGARDTEENERIAADIRIRWDVRTAALPFDAQDIESHAAFFTQCHELMGDHIDGLIVCVGWMPNQIAAQSDFNLASATIDINYTGVASIAERFAADFESRRRGFIAVVSSVAGDRGRQSNYFYGSAKAGLTAYLQGLRNRLFHANVSVLTIKPGFVDTKMAFGLPNLMLVATPERVARNIFNAIRKRKNVIYTPWFWHGIMKVFVHVPETIFKRMRL